MTCRHALQGPVIGHQDDGDGGLLELRNCVACGSTLAVEVQHRPVSGCDCVTCCGMRAKRDWAEQERVERRADAVREAQAVAQRGECRRGCECVGCEFRRLRAARAALQRIGEQDASYYRRRAYARKGFV